MFQRKTIFDVLILLVLAVLTGQLWPVASASGIMQSLVMIITVCAWELRSLWLTV